LSTQAQAAAAKSSLTEAQRALERAEDELKALRAMHEGALAAREEAKEEAEEARRAAEAAEAEAAKLRVQAGMLAERMRGAEAEAARVQEANRCV
jgi:chromosome segregation ATPase